MATEGPRPGESYNDWVRRMAAKERAEGTLGPPTPPPPPPERIGEGPRPGESYNVWVRRMAAEERAAPTPTPPTEGPQWRLIEARGKLVEAPPPTLEQLKAEAGLAETARKEVQLRAAQLQGYLGWRPAPDVKTLGMYLEEGMRDAPPELHELYRKKHEEYTEFYEEEYKPAYERYQRGYGRYESAYGAFTHVEETMAAAEAGVMRGLVIGALEGEAPPWARIWEPAKPLDVSQIQSSLLAPAIPSQEVIARRHLKNLVLLISGAPVTKKEKIEALKIGIIKPSDIWQPPPPMVPAEAEKYFVGMPPKWYLGEAPTPGEVQLQKAMEKVGEYFAYSGTVWYGVKESPLGKIPLLGEIAVGYVKAAEPWGKALAELIVSTKGGPLLTGKAPILREGPVFTMGLDPTIAGRLGYVPGGFPAPKPPGLISLETLGGAVFYAGLFAGATKTVQLSAESATYGFKIGARGTGIFTKPLRALAKKIGPPVEAELVYTEFQLAKASASVKGAVRGIFALEPFYYYPRVGPAGPPKLTHMYKALDAMKQRLGVPKLPTVVRRAGRPGELAHYRLGGVVKYEYVKPAPHITGYWDVPITKFGGVPPLPSELVWVKDSMRVPTDLRLIVEPGGKLAEIQHWYKLIPTGKAKPILYQEYLESLRKAVGQTVSATRLSGFEAAVGKKAGTGYYWSLERLGVTPAEKAVGWFGVKTRGKIFPEAVSRAGVSEFVFDEQLIKLAAAFKKDKAVMGFITEKAGTQVSAVAGGVRSQMEKLMDFVSFGRFRVGVSGGAAPVGDGVLGGYGQFARAGQQLLLAREPALEAAWGPWLFPESSQLGLTAAGLGVGVGTAIGVRANAAASAISGLKVGALPAAGVRQVPRMGQVPFFELAPFQAQVSGAGVAHAQAVAQVQKSVLVQIQAQMQQTAKATPFVFPYGELKKKPRHIQKVTISKFKPFERIWPVGRIEKLFEPIKFKEPKLFAGTPKTPKAKDAFDARGLEKAFKVHKTGRRR